MNTIYHVANSDYYRFYYTFEVSLCFNFIVLISANKSQICHAIMPNHPLLSVYVTQNVQVDEMIQ